MLIVLRCQTTVDENLCNKRRPNVIILLLFVITIVLRPTRGSPYTVLGDTVRADLPAYHYRNIYHLQSQVPCDAATAVHAPSKDMTIILPIILRIEQKEQSSRYKLV